jgi:hypothetical protein
MKTIIKLIFLTFIGLTIGAGLGFILEVHFLYSRVVFLTLNTALVLLLILSAARAFKEEKHILYTFGWEMSGLFHYVVSQFQKKSLLIIGIVFGFIGVLDCFETKAPAVGIAILILFVVSYFRAFLSYQKFGEFR